MSSYVQRQPRLHGLQLEREIPELTWLDRSVRFAFNLQRKTLQGLLRSHKRLVRQVMSASAALESATAEELAAELETVRATLRCRPLDDALVVRSFALAREISGRELGMRHHHTQVRASLALLRGRIAEMATGEGKTLAATLAAATAAMAGVPVHLVTVNDYLAERDAEEMMPLYRALGLSVGCVIHDMEPHERRAAYDCDITYCSNKELVFDYLKDQISLDGRRHSAVLQQELLANPALGSKLLQRGLHFAIVDEADSVLVDEARTPLIISGEEKFGELEEQLLRQAMTMAEDLENPRDYSFTDAGSLRLTPRGERKLREQAEPLGGLWLSRDYREGLGMQALSALYRYERDRDYIIDEEGAVQIVDPYTGRVMPGRSWGQGLHQMVEIKEKVELTRPRETKAEISYQNFFRKYACLSGMTGTALEVRREMLDVFTVPCEVIPLLKPSRRRKRRRSVYISAAAKTAAIARYVGELQQAEQPVLVGTATVEASEDLSVALTEMDIEHRVLNARQDKAEAEVIAEAGAPGAVTIATSMAGRGTDIKLQGEAEQTGGLHVLITELQDASRIDRQLAGRCARQGDPGAVSYMLSFEDRLVERLFSKRARLLLRNSFRLVPFRGFFGFHFLRLSQRWMERIHYNQRMRLLRSDLRRQRMLSFTGEH